MCGEGLTKSQMKINQTIFDESENESDLKMGRIFTLNASKIDVDLTSSSDENIPGKKQSIETTQSFESSHNSDKGMDRSNQSKKGEKSKESSEVSSDDKFEHCKL